MPSLISDFDRHFGDHRLAVLQQRMFLPTEPGQSRNSCPASRFYLPQKRPPHSPDQHWIILWGHLKESHTGHKTLRGLKRSSLDEYGSSPQEGDSLTVFTKEGLLSIYIRNDILIAISTIDHYDPTISAPTCMYSVRRRKVQETITNIFIEILIS